MEYDDIIVGAGSAGAALAARLSEDAKRNVLLLEAGPDYSAVEQTPTDLLNTWIAAGPHDWVWSLRPRLPGKSRTRAAR
jgi:choline dehydrogenase